MRPSSASTAVLILPNPYFDPSPHTDRGVMKQLIVSSILAGLSFGATAGAIGAALLAPKRGDQLKSDAQSYWEQVKQAGAEAEAMRRAEATPEE